MREDVDSSAKGGMVSQGSAGHNSSIFLPEEEI